MAARLMEIKSKMLLPAPEIEEDQALEEELEDPRRSLVVELLAYRETKERAILLEEAYRERSLRFENPRMDLPAPPPNTLDLAEASVWDLSLAFQRILDEAARREAVHVVEPEDLPLDEVIRRIRQGLDQSEGGSLALTELCSPALGVHGLISYFLGLLEMTRMRLITVTQSGEFGEIRLTQRVLP